MISILRGAWESDYNAFYCNAVTVLRSIQTNRRNEWIKVFIILAVAVGFSGAIAERIRRPVKTIFPAIDILTIDVIRKSGLGYPVFFSVANKR